MECSENEPACISKTSRKRLYSFHLVQSLTRGILALEASPRLWERQDSHVERPMQTATGSSADSQPQLPHDRSEPSGAFRLPASKFLQMMLSGDVSHPLPQMQIQEQTKCWGGLLFVLQLHTTYWILVPQPGIRPVPLAAGSTNSTREFPNTVVV